MSKYTAQVMSFKACVAALGDKTCVKIDHNTILHRSDDQKSFIITLHGNKIIQVTKSGFRVYRGIGHLTKTTKDRLNKFLPSSMRFYTNNHTDYVSYTRTCTVAGVKADIKVVEPMEDGKFYKYTKI
jgi:hypothetical protein